MNALLPLASRMSARHESVVLSSFTRSGADFAAAHGAASQALTVRAPLDLWWVVRRVFRQLAPRLLVLEALELWPALLRAAARQGVPVAIVNGRLSARSLRRYGYCPALFRPAFARLAAVVALTEQDAERFLRAGVRSDVLAVAASTKHGATIPDGGATRRGPKVVLGSLHAGEETALLAPLLERLPRGVRLEIAPRYPQRARTICQRVARAGWKPTLRSEVGATADVIVHDGVGGLAEAYADATVAYVGGSLVPRGGHNVIEAAARGVPVITGPYIEHCGAEVEALRCVGAARVTKDGPTAVNEVLALLEYRADLGAAARQVALALAGAVERVDGVLQALLARGGSRAADGH